MTTQEIKINKDFTFSIEKFGVDGQLVPSSGAFEIFDNTGSSKQSGSLIIDSVGTMTATFLTANNDTLNPNFKFSFSYVIAGDPTNDNLLFDVVNTPLINNITDKDLFEYVPSLRASIYGQSGTCSANGTVNTIIDTSLSSDSRDWDGARGEVKDGERLVDFRINNYDRLTGTITFTPTLINATIADQTYSLRLSYQGRIDTAFNLARLDIRNQVPNTAGYIDSNVLNNLITYKALEIICSSEREQADDKWDLWSKEYMGMYTEFLLKLSAAYDNNQDGDISNREVADKASFNTIKNVR